MIELNEEQRLELTGPEPARVLDPSTRQRKVEQATRLNTPTPMASAARPEDTKTKPQQKKKLAKSKVA